MFKKICFLLAISGALLMTGCSHNTTKDGFKLNAEGAIVTEVPARAAGQTDVLGLTVPAMDTVRVGFVGLGMRGSAAVVRYTYVPGVKITAICDVEPDRVEASQKALATRGFPAAAGYSGDLEAYKKLCEDPNVDLVYICTDWVHHAPVALYAMEHGKHVAIEVPSAYSLKDCWALVDMAEKTRLHCMILENCCYDFFELSTLQMAREGLFGEVVHAEGSYCHNLDPYWDEYWNSWRLTFNKEHRGDAYPTHGFGPVCQVLNIHRGDRLKTLVALDTKAFNGPKLVAARGGKDPDDFANGDVSTTVIRTENGKTVLIEHDVMNPRPYSRMYQVVGTDGYAGKYPVQQLCFRKEALAGEEVDYANLKGETTLSGDKVNEFMEQHRSPILTPELEALAKEVGGHGGMDFIMDYRLIYCLRNGLPLDIDVYDLAEWCCVSELSAISMNHGGMPVEVPDFTRGAWNRIDGFSYAFAE
ncbi:MAG: Gfo/Idh/MocA family oxidoreductase [Bacteroidales bacterium]|nr:Gfo/Idh/MocA family oxidoreductase [Bacteroidales bacterium]